MKKIDRRKFLQIASTAALVGTAVVLTGCEGGGSGTPPNSDGSTLLSDLKPLNGRCDWNTDVPEDPFGNTYTNAANYAVLEVFGRAWSGGIADSGYTYRGAIEYRVYKKYNRLTMDLTPYKSIGQNGTAFVQIYADDKLIQSSPKITQKTDTVKLEADISGAEYIRINITLSKGAYNTTFGALIISNAKLWKA